MKIIRIVVLVQFALLALTVTGCRRSSSEVWEDTKTASRHMGRGIGSLGGKHGDSRQVVCRDDFGDPSEGFFIQQNEEFVALQDEQGNDMISMENARQSRENPGDPGSSIPGIEAFRDPSQDQRLSVIFRNIHFDLNSNLIKGEENLRTIRNVADYMIKHPRTYLFVEGHCCERGPAAYNLALGSRRANAVRNLLVSEGVDPDRIFTISYGKERPLVPVTDEGSMVLNRRVQFKIYER